MGSGIFSITQIKRIKIYFFTREVCFIQFESSQLSFWKLFFCSGNTFSNSPDNLIRHGLMLGHIISFCGLFRTIPYSLHCHRKPKTSPRNFFFFFFFETKPAIPCTGTLVAKCVISGLVILKQNLLFTFSKLYELMGWLSILKLMLCYIIWCQMVLIIQKY